jgi:hypothetical protein
MDAESQLGHPRLSPRQIITAMSGLIIAMLLWASLVAAAGFVLAWFIKQVPLRGHTPAPAQAAESTAEELAV